MKRRRLITVAALAVLAIAGFSHGKAYADSSDPIVGHTGIVGLSLSRFREFCAGFPGPTTFSKVTPRDGMSRYLCKGPADQTFDVSMDPESDQVVRVTWTAPRTGPDVPLKLLRDQIDKLGKPKRAIECGTKAAQHCLEAEWEIPLGGGWILWKRTRAMANEVAGSYFTTEHLRLKKKK